MHRVALLVPITSRGRTLAGTGELDLLRVLVPSLLATASFERASYEVWLGHDAGDALFERDDVRAAIVAALEPRVRARFLRCEGTAHAPAWVWNALLEAAHADGCDWFFQLGDDVRLETAGWTEAYVEALERSPGGPGVGVTGPVDRNHPGLLTQSFVGRAHHAIFGSYYPAAFRNWFSDDWLQRVYGPELVLLPDPAPTVTNTGGHPRYTIDHAARTLLDGQVAEGKARLARRTGGARVIAYSLWGSNPKYTVGALRCAEAAREHFPGWRCRFHLGRSVPDATRAALRAHEHVDLVERPEAGDWTGLFWRFLPAGEAVLLSRDCDSRPTAREKAAVEAWLASDRELHVMRDHPFHDTAILGGLWGVRGGLLRDMEALVAAYLANRPDVDRWQVDQDFLRQVVWPRVRDRTLVHDELFGGLPFPTPRRDLEFVGEPLDHQDRPCDPRHRAALGEALAGRLRYGPLRA